jgi:hypothetical protein
MEEFITSYKIPFEDFRTLMTETNALMAGSAALALYLKQEGVDPGFEPNDLDIWVEETHDTWLSSGRVNELANDWKFALFLVKHGYDLTTKYDSTVNAHYYNTMTDIKHIFHFINSDGKKVQVIMIRDSNPVQYIQRHFDLTACMSWWNSIDNVFRTSFPGLTCKKEIQILPGFSKEERTLKRVEKYIARGFIIRESPCPALRMRDPHDNMRFLENIIAFDVFAYDDVNAVEFLRQSSYHVLLHVGDQFHAYHRKQLCDYLKEHIQEHPDCGDVCELPHKQQVQQSILQILPYSDYSIISLKQIIDNLYDLEYYTTAQWAAKTPGRPQELLQHALGPLEPLQQVLPLYNSGRRVVRLSDLAGLTESLSRSGLSSFFRI